jgi:hypothetical protein
MENADVNEDAASIAGNSEPEHARYFETQVPPSHTWRSLGGYLDYDLWTERERFVELDRAIQAQAIATAHQLHAASSSGGPNVNGSD